MKIEINGICEESPKRPKLKLLQAQFDGACSWMVLKIARLIAFDFSKVIIYLGH
jgi:hypothetical protein